MTPIHTARFPIRWGDMDALGHVNNATYFAYFENARVEALYALAELQSAAGAVPVLAKTSAQFRRPLTFPAEILVDVFAAEPGRSSLLTTYRVRAAADEATVYAEGEALMVWVNPETGRPVSMPDALRERLAALAAAAPGG